MCACARARISSCYKKHQFTTGFEPPHYLSASVTRDKRNRPYSVFLHDLEKQKLHPAPTSPSTGTGQHADFQISAKAVLTR